MMITDIRKVPISTLSVSNSEIQMWKDCRRRWWLTYYRELGLLREDQDPTGALPLGARVHAALQAMYERGVNPIDAIDEIYADDIAMLLEADRLERITALQQEQDLAHAMLEGYLLWVAENAIDAEYKIIASEQILEVDSGFPNVRMRAVLDQMIIRRSDGALLFRDFKTAASFDQAVPLLPINEQMKFYHMIQHLHASFLAKTQGVRTQRTDGALYLMLRKVKRTTTAKPPFYAQHVIPFNHSIMTSTWTRVHKVLEEIIEARAALDQGSDHQYVVPPRPSYDCSWKCVFFELCPMFDDGSNAEGMVAEHFDHVDPNERYHRDDQKEKYDN